jgi:phage shock protein E
MTRSIALLLLLLAAGCNEPAQGVVILTPEALLSDPPREVLILDVRTREEFSQSHVPGARNIPHDELAGRLDELGADHERNVVVYCESGRRAGMAESTLLAAGFTAVHHLEGDMKAWRAAERPTEGGGAL